ncbi:uncharacterized protein MYCFIDRAFT_134643 [Pseudocercospora fijiensis CIRAD86]|uniref:Nuclear envelope protein n=1 Tax=Pseudocercospora fijiensis (strain CIRAD86) TaxID=383855 RepID=M3A025_PSEFD|nr:uncharacterized protein MYCFIDRAFT_134643 [Pseudocercospora fijiensis CIRAD86]EME84519.1 hypothetical protein MYCFIDRAFT_134643 [Pseudocercospora fijiensis CIRAD86]
MATSSRLADPTRPIPVERIKLYKDFLTPQLHRRFCSAAALTLAFCLVDSFILSNSGSYIWSWFPIGPAGLRALLLFIPCLAIFIVRMANIHIGDRTSVSGVETLLKHTSLWKTLYTGAWYAFSAWFFGEVYIWSRSSSAELAMVDPGAAYERPRVNENPVFLRCMFLVLAVSQTLLHLMRDYDRVRIAEQNVEADRKNAVFKAIGLAPDAFDNSKWIPRAFIRLLEQNGTILTRSCNLTVTTMFLVNNLVYWLVLRRFAWKMNYFFARVFFSDLTPDAPPTGILHVGRLAWQTFTASLMLSLLWELSNQTFDIFVSQPPVKKEQPLTNEVKDARGIVLHRSKDPNGSLITGLNSKKDLTKTFAFWELYLICTQYEQRRQTIYTEVDRRDESTWSHVCKLCLKEIKDVQERVKTAIEPVKFKTKQDEEKERKQQSQHFIGLAKEDNGLKKIADSKVIEDGDVFARRKPDLFNTLGNMAKSVGQSPGAQSFGSVGGRKAIEWGAEKVPAEYRQRLRPEEIERQATGIMADALKSTAGEPFRQTFARRVIATVFGSPYSKISNISHATKSLTRLVVRSIAEDQYGQTQKDIASIVRTYTEVIVAVEKYVKELKPHWTDVEFMEGKSRRVKEVDELLLVLKEGLAEIMLTFGEYVDVLGLTKKEVREAKNASARPSAETERQEMLQVG